MKKERKLKSFFSFIVGMIASRFDLPDSIHGSQAEEDASVFFLELLIRVVLQNR